MLSTVYVAVLWNAESGTDARGKRNQPCSQGTEGLGGWQGEGEVGVKIKHGTKTPTIFIRLKQQQSLCHLTSVDLSRNQGQVEYGRNLSWNIDSIL